VIRPFGDDSVTGQKKVVGVSLPAADRFIGWNEIVGICPFFMNQWHIMLF
jgi:hypothetical protein